MPTTPDEWLPILAKRLDDRFIESKRDDAYPGITRLRRYAHGKPDLPEMGKNLRASWEKFQKKARRNYGGLAVGSLADRCAFNGIRIGTSDDSPTIVAARRILRDNRADTQFAEAILDMLETRWGYLLVGRSDDGHAVITREKPEQFIAATDPLRPWKALACLKVWRDDSAAQDYARVWVAGAAAVFHRSTRNHSGNTRIGASGEGWEPLGEPEVYDGEPPVVILERDQAFLEPHLDLIDAIVLGKLNRLVITAMQAFRQRALRRKEGQSGDFDTDEDGNEVDLRKVFEPAPGALWDLPEGIDIWESQTTDIQPLVSGETQDAKDFAAQTRTPVSVLIPDGANQSAEGASTGKEGQVAEAKAITRQISPALAVLVVYALRVEDVDLGDDTVEILWIPPEHVSLSEKYAAAAAAKGVGLSARTIKRDILGMSPDQIRQDEADLASDQLAAALLTIGQQQAPQPAQANGRPDAGAA